MIQRLCDFGLRKREELSREKNDLGYLDYNLTLSSIDAIILIDVEGKFINIYPCPERESFIENLERTSGTSARFLTDNAEYILGYPQGEERSITRLNAFKERLKSYKDIKILEPLFRFYNNENSSLTSANIKIAEKIHNKELSASGIFAFQVQGMKNLLHEDLEVRKAFAEKTKIEVIVDTQCSICGRNDCKIARLHDKVKGTKPIDSKSALRTLISFNKTAFNSYGLEQSYNAGICTNCAKNYVFGLNWLLSNGNEIEIEDKNGKIQSRYKYTNRQNFGSDTAMVYWTRNGAELDELDNLFEPKEEDVGNLIQSIRQGHGKHNTTEITDYDKFYSLTVSGAAARIAVRDWIEISLGEYRKNIAQWFDDIGIRAYGATYYSSLYFMAKATQSKRSKDDPSLERTATHLWKAALKRTAPPLWILSAVLKRLRIAETNEEEGNGSESVTPERAALIRIILNRNFNYNGENIMTEQLDLENTSPAYICGQIFAVMEVIQRAALGKELNAGIRDRFFSAASIRPASTFGRLMKLSQNHIAKIRQDKHGLAIFLDRKLGELCSKLTGNSFPEMLSLEEQGQFALGYYHRKQLDYDEIQKNKEFKQIMEEN